MKLLVVDDNRILVEQMVKYFTRHGHRTVSAYGVPEAQEKLKHLNFDFCISDLRMDGQSGMDLLKIIKNDYPSTQVIIMTAYGSTKRALQALKEGAMDFIHKPFQMEQMLELIGDCLNIQKEKTNIKKAT